MTPASLKLSGVPAALRAADVKVEDLPLLLTIQREATAAIQKLLPSVAEAVRQSSKLMQFLEMLYNTTNIQYVVRSLLLVNGAKLKIDAKNCKRFGVNTLDEFNTLFTQEIYPELVKLGLAKQIKIESSYGVMKFTVGEWI